MAFYSFVCLKWRGLSPHKRQVDKTLKGNKRTFEEFIWKFIGYYNNDVGDLKKKETHYQKLLFPNVGTSYVQLKVMLGSS